MEDYDVDNLTYEHLLTKVRGDLKFFEVVKKKQIVKALAKKLEQIGTPKETICATIVDDLRGYGINSSYIRECLDPEYKQQEKARQNSANADKKVTVEVSTSGTEDAAKNEDEEKKYEPLNGARLFATSSIQTADDLDDAVNKFREEVVHNVPAAIDKVRIAELERERDDLKKELASLANAIAGVKQDVPSDIAKNPAVIRLQAKITKLEQDAATAEQDKKELAEALKQQGMFKVAKEIDTAVPDNKVGHFAKEPLVKELPSEVTLDLTRFVAAMIAMRNNNAKLVYITVDKEGLVSAIEADYQRARRLKVGVIT